MNANMLNVFKDMHNLTTSLFSCSHHTTDVLTQYGFQSPVTVQSMLFHSMVPLILAISPFLFNGPVSTQSFRLNSEVDTCLKPSPRIPKGIPCCIPKHFISFHCIRLYHVYSKGSLEFLITKQKDPFMKVTL